MKGLIVYDNDTCSISIRTFFKNKMKLFLNTLFVILLFSLLSMASAETVILTDDTTILHLGTNINILEDASGKLTMSGILSSDHKHKFTRSTKMNPSFGYTKSVYWVRFTIISHSTYRSKWLLELDYPLMDSIHLFMVDGTNIVLKKKCGSLYPFYKRDLRHRNFVFEIEIEPGSTRTVYMRFQNTDRMDLPLLIRSPKEFHHYVYTEQYIMGLYYGILLVMLLYNFFLFFSVKDTPYLYYVLYIFTMGLFQLGQNGYLYLALSYFTDSPPVHFISLTQALIIVSIFQFSQSYLNTRGNAPTIHRVMTTLKILGIFYLTCPLYLDYAECIKAGVALAMIMIPVVLTAGLVAMRQRYRPAYYFMAAWSVMFIAGFIFLLRSLAIVPLNMFTSYILHIGTSIEVVLLSLGLGDRYNMMKEEKDRISNELKMAQKIHSSLLPVSNPQLHGIVSHIEYIPAEEVGGDLYDYHTIGPGKIGIMVSDVSGHGFSAALVASMVKIAFSLQLPHADNAEKVLEGMRTVLTRELSDNFVTASYTIFDIENKLLVTANSGHTPLLIYQRNNNSLIELYTKGSCISMLPVKASESHTFPLSINDRIIIYTDGIIECRNRHGELYGVEKFKEFIVMNKELNVSQFSQKLITELHRWKRGSASFSDDITLVVIDII